MGISFKRGYSAVNDEVKRQEENREKMGKTLWRFFLAKDKDEADVRFLTEEPITFYEHTVQNTVNGKTRYDNVICIGEDCPLCENGDRPSFKGAFLMYDKRPYEYTDKDGKKQTGKGQLRLYVAGTKVLSQLERLSERYGLTDRDYTITRAGSGTSTTYMFDRSDNVNKLTEAEIKNMLTDKLKEKYNGTSDSLYSIVEEQIQLLANIGTDDDEEPVSDNRDNLVGADALEDEDDGNSTSPQKPRLGFKKKAPKENSAKTLFKKTLNIN